jgi:long-chain acyl-CoA synthetase
MTPIIPVDPSMTLVHHFLERSARLFPDKTALIHGKVRATYSEINNRANNLTNYFLSLGVQKGDRIALLMENCLEYVVSYYGILKAGAVAVPLSTDLKSQGLCYAIEDLEAKILISSQRFQKLIEASKLSDLGLSHLIMKGSPRSTTQLLNDSTVSSGSETSKRSALCAMPYAITPFDSVSSPSPHPPIPPSTDGDLASIIYTSGSTGVPKGVMLFHRNIVENTFSICQYLQLTESDIQMCVLPFFYVMGKSLLNTHFAVGGTIVINNKFAYPATVLNEMIAEKVTGFSGVPSTFAYLLYRSPLAAGRDKLTSLRYVSQAGGHMSRSIKTELRQVLPSHTDIYVMYGATEASARLSYLEPESFTKKMDSIGKAIPGVELKVLDETGEPLPAGQVGELVAQGLNIMPGYWRNSEATYDVLNDHGYHTGDLAYQDEDGYFYVVGRKDYVLKVDGHKVSPLEVEDILMDSGLLLESAVLGIPDGFSGHKLIALVAARNGECSESMILRYCANRLPKFKVPSAVKFIKELPKNLSGKIDRAGCLELLVT